MHKVLLVIGFSVCTVYAHAAQLKLDGEYGCADPATQKSRAVLMQNIVSSEPHYVAQRQEMKESLLNLSTYMCKPLNGTFTVLSRAEGLVEVQTSDGAPWVSP
jgi:hypothetical protein